MTELFRSCESILSEIVIEHSIPLLRFMRRIVIIDDEPGFGEILAKMLNSLGYEITISTDASFTLDLHDSDIVFLDVLMPDNSGPQVLNQLAHRGFKCALILVGGNSEQLDEAEKYAKFLGLNVIGALNTPFRLVDVEGSLEAAEIHKDNY